MVKEEELLSIGGESVVYRVGSSVIKTYDPASPLNPFSDKYAKIYGDVSQNSSPFSPKFREGLYKTELIVLRALSDLEGGMVPTFRGTDEGRRDIEMAYIDLDTLQEAVMGERLNATIATEMAVENLAKFKLFTHENFQDLQRASVDGRYQRLRRMNIDQEIGKWVSKFYNIIFQGSTEFHNFLRTTYGVPPEELDHGDKSDAIQYFLDQIGIDLKERVGPFIERDRALTREDKSFIWGEAKLQNMFFDPVSNRVITIDFPRARTGAGNYVDLSSILYNTDRLIHGTNGPLGLEGEVDKPFDPEEEVISANIAKEYFRIMKVPAREIPERQALLQATRLKDTIRELANWCKKDPFEIKRVMGHGREASPYNGHTKELFLERMFETFRQTLEFYGFENGWRALAKNSRNLKILRQVREQTDCVVGILRDTGVMKGNQEILGALEDAFAPDYNSSDDEIDDVNKNGSD